MRTADFDYRLPAELIAQQPAAERDLSRLLVLNRASGGVQHRVFGDVLAYLNAGDILVLNDSRVIPARLRGTNARTNGQFELLLLEENGVNDWWAMVRPGKRARIGTQVILRDRRGESTGIRATVVGTDPEGHRRLRFEGGGDIAARLVDLGEVPLPPYINRPDGGPGEEDTQRYQTVYARAAGSVAAPTAGLHFTESLLDRVASLGVRVCFLTLHVGFGTFAPVKAETLAGHIMHEERYCLSEAAVRLIQVAKAGGYRVIAVGTTTLRVLESVAAQNQGRLMAGEGRTRLFIYPPWNFRIVDALLTNFHLPRSTLLMLACAFGKPRDTAGRELVLSAYAEAVRERYRFFSYGDAMLIV
jgi:S-adenosylmethionine:tRNA ribosyltransferase-isomerase